MENDYQMLLIVLGFITQKNIALACARHKYRWNGPRLKHKFQKPNFKKLNIKFILLESQIN